MFNNTCSQRFQLFSFCRPTTKNHKKKKCVRHHSVSIHHKIASSKQTSPLLTPKNVATALFPASDKFLDASTHGKDAIA